MTPALKFLQNKDKNLYEAALKFKIEGPPPPLPLKDQTQFLQKTIIGQQISRQAAETIWGRSLAHLDPFDPVGLTKAGVSARKLDCLRQMSGLDCRLSDEKIEAELLKIKGVGPWTVDMFLIFARGRPDIFAWSDLILNRAAKTYFGAKDQDPKTLVASFSPHRTTLSLLFWRLRYGEGL